MLTCSKFSALSYTLNTIFRSTFLKLKWQKMEQQAVLERISQNNKYGEELVKFIKNELPALKTAATKKYYHNKELELLEKNAHLKKELEYWLNKVMELEIVSNIPQYSLPSQPTGNLNVVLKSEAPKKVEINQQVQDVNEKPKSEVQQTEKQLAKKEKKEKESKPAKEKPPTEDKEINVSRLDLRIGRIISAKKHPDAESLYVEDIDVGENKPRTVVSGLVKYVPLEDMQNRLVVVLCNLKPAKMRGVMSEAMVMCASTPEKVEILVPPADSVPGDRVICEDFLGDPDSLLPPKKKIFEQVAPDLKTNENCIATYKSSALKVLNKGEIKAPSLTNVQIK